MSNDRHGAISDDDAHHDHDHEHTHDHDHDHEALVVEDDMGNLLGQQMIDALQAILVRRGILSAGEVTLEIQNIEAPGTHLGAKIVARAWVDKALSAIEIPSMAEPETKVKTWPHVRTSSKEISGDLQRQKHTPKTSCPIRPNSKPPTSLMP